MSGTALPYILGVDIGSMYSKLVLLDRFDRVVCKELHSIGIHFSKLLGERINAISAAHSLIREELHIVATGFGRHELSCAERVITEIEALAWGCRSCGPLPMSIIDIGGQDAKIVHLDQHGKRKRFSINNSCAAGTGAFLDLLSERLQVKACEVVTALPAPSTVCNLGSICSVFAMTKYLELLRKGVAIEAIIAGAYESVIDRLLEMGMIENPILFAGGVIVHHPVLAQMLAVRTKQQVTIAPDAHYRVALGAAYWLRNQLTPSL